MNEPSGDAAVQELARRLVDAQGALAVPLPGGDVLRTLAWALKDLCLVAFNTEPARSVAAAAALRRVCEGCVGAHDASGQALAPEIAALADWAEGIAQITQGHMAEALDHFGSAQTGLRRLGLVGPAAQTCVPRMIALSMLGRLDDAAACGEAVQREFLDQGDRQAAGKVSLNLGNLSMRREDPAAATRHYREAAVLFARSRDHQHSVMADIGLADAWVASGQYDEALRTYARARMRAEQHGLAVLTAMIDESAALLALARGRYREALAGLEASRQGYERLAMPQHLAIAEKQLADAYLALRLLPEALRLFQQAQAQFQSLDMPYEQAWTQVQTGKTLALMGQPEAATQALADASRLFLGLANPVGQAAVELTRAEGLLAQAAQAPRSAPTDAAGDAVTSNRAATTATTTDNDNDNDTEPGLAGAAAALARQAAAAFASAGLPDGETRALALQAQAWLQAGQLDTADALFSQAAERAAQLSLGGVALRCLSGQGGLALARGQRAEARAAFEAAIDRFEDQRRALPGDELRSAFLGEHLLPYQALLRLALQDHAAQPDPARALAVLAALDRMRARSLDERLSDSHRTEDDAAGQAMRTRLNWLYHRTQRLDVDDAVPAALQEERRQLERSLLEHARRQRLAAAAAPAAGPLSPAAGQPSPAVGPSAPAVGPASPVAGLPLPDAGAPGPDELQTLAATLLADEALVAYGVLDDELFACVVTRAGVQVQRALAPWSAVRETLQALMFQMDALRHGQAALQAHLPVLTRRATARLQALHQQVWAPLAGLLPSAGRVLLVPHAQMAMLPFGALHDGQCSLAERFELALAASARMARRGLARPPRPPRQALALGESTRLLHADVEASEVAALYGSRAWVGPEATLARLQAQVGEADVIHLACHGQFRSDNPMFSALHLADAALTVEATEGLQLQAATVVLSACDTSRAQAGQGDEMFGLVRAFLVAGASRVLASLWPVDDAVTLCFMRAFHSALRGGAGPAAALRSAQVQVQASHPHPAHWAAFVLHGGW